MKTNLRKTKGDQKTSDFVDNNYWPVTECCSITNQFDFEESLVTIANTGSVKKVYKSNQQ